MIRPPSNERSRPGLTLVELIAAMAVLGIIGASIAPLILSSAETYASSASVRRAAEDSAFAVDRIVRLLREAPRGAAPGTLDLAVATEQAVVFGDDRGVRLIGDEVHLFDETGAGGVLISGVAAFEITYLAEDGLADSSATPAATQRFVVRIVANGFESRVVVFPRVRAVG